MAARERKSDEVSTTEENLAVIGITPSQNNTAHVISTRSYTLNVDKALKNKIQDCETVFVQYDVTDGGVTGHMDTATFEIFRSSCSAWYENLPESDGRCVIDISQDKRKKAVVQQTYRVKRLDPETDEQVGYTLNLYPTCNKLLLNGRDIDRFMESHLPKIHEIMCQSLQDTQFGSIANYNSILAAELQKVLRDRQSRHPHVPDADVQSDNGPQDTLNINPPPQALTSPVPSNIDRNKPEVTALQDIRCLGCKRNCQSRSAFCEKGSHWMHYRCDKLTDDVIKRLQNDPGVIYVCKRCQVDRENTDVKAPVSIGPTPSSSSTLHLPPRHSCTEDENQTFASAILTEEHEEACVVCGTGVEEASQRRCTECSLVSHGECMSTGDIDLCLNCAAANDQLSNADNKREVGPSQDDAALHISQDGQITDQTKSVATAAADLNIPVECGPRQTQEGLEAASEVRTAKHASRTSKTRGTAAEGLGVKQRELRQLELRLKKWEEELWLKEARSADMENDIKRLEEYLSKTEARNLELESTVRTLQRKISLLEDFRPKYPRATENLILDQSCENTTYTEKRNQFTSQFTHNRQIMPANEDLICGIHQQVTRFVLQKVERQLNELELMDLGVHAQYKAEYPRQHTYSESPVTTTVGAQFRTDSMTRHTDVGFSGTDAGCPVVSSGEGWRAPRQLTGQKDRRFQSYINQQAEVQVSEIDENQSDRMSTLRGAVGSSSHEWDYSSYPQSTSQDSRNGPRRDIRFSIDRKGAGGPRQASAYDERVQSSKRGGIQNQQRTVYPVRSERKQTKQDKYTSSRNDAMIGSLATKQYPNMSLNSIHPASGQPIFYTADVPAHMAIQQPAFLGRTGPQRGKI